jgi:serine/threonine-protein kinase
MVELEGSRRRRETTTRALAALSHPNILAIHDYGTHGAVTYAVVELLQGETLRSRLANAPLPWREAVEIGAAVAEGLAAARAKGIIHSDLKPSRENSCASPEEVHRRHISFESSIGEK